MTTTQATDGATIAYRTAGREWRTPVIFSHSLGSDGGQWEPQVEDLRADHFVITVDTRGHGGSDAPPGPYSVDQMAADIISVADAIGLPTFHFCGLSLGGLIGQWLAVHHPQRLASVALCNTAAKIGDADRWNERIEIAGHDGMGPLVDPVVARWFNPDFAERHPEWLLRARTTLAATSPVGYAACCAALRDTDLRQLTATIAVRTIVIGGSNDQSTPVEQAQWLHDQIAGSALVVLDAAHLSNLDQPAEFTAALLRFLS